MRRSVTTPTSSGTSGSAGIPTTPHASFWTWRTSAGTACLRSTTPIGSSSTRSASAVHREPPGRRVAPKPVTVARVASIAPRAGISPTPARLSHRHVTPSRAMPVTPIAPIASSQPCPFSRGAVAPSRHRDVLPRPVVRARATVAIRADSPVLSTLSHTRTCRTCTVHPLRAVANRSADKPVIGASPLLRRRTRAASFLWRVSWVSACRAS